MKAQKYVAGPLLALVLAGCGSDEARRYAVEGTVTQDGKPYPDALIEFAPDPSNAAITAGSDVTGAEGNFVIIGMGRSGLAPGKYQVVIAPKPPPAQPGQDEAEAAAAAEMLQEALEARGLRPQQIAAMVGQQGPSGTFEAEILPEKNALTFDVKSTGAENAGG